MDWGNKMTGEIPKKTRVTPYYQIVNLEKLDIINMILGGIKPTVNDVKINVATITGTPKEPKIEWRRSELEAMSVRFLLKLYRTRAHRKVSVR